MRDSRRFHERPEIRLDRPQVVWLTLGNIVALGLAFALGFGLGRRHERIAPEAPPADPVAQADSDKAMHEELTFYEGLTAGEPAEGPTPQPPPPAAKPKSALAASSADSAPSASAVANIESDTRLQRAVARARTAGESMGADDPRVREALNAGPAGRGDYTVQVSAFQSIGEAKAYAAGLERKGYRPFVVTSAIPGMGTWYRVRLGRFPSEVMASRAKYLLEGADIPAWILRSE